MVEILKLILDGIGLTIFCIVLGWEVIVSYPEWCNRDRRAHELLRSVLSGEQYDQLTRNGYLDIPSPQISGRIYRIPRVQGLVRVIERGRLKQSLCLQPVEKVPDADIVAMHKLMIEADEESYLQTANILPFNPLDPHVEIL